MSNRHVPAIEPPPSQTSPQVCACLSFFFYSLTSFTFVFLQGELWHKLRDKDFMAVEDFEDKCNSAIVKLIKKMMAKDAAA